MSKGIKAIVEVDMEKIRAIQHSLWWMVNDNDPDGWSVGARSVGAREVADALLDLLNEIVGEEYNG